MIYVAFEGLKWILRHITFILLILFASHGISQITINISASPELPNNLENQIYIAGNFNNWNAKDKSFKLKDTGGKLFLTFTPEREQAVIEFKFTRGDWKYVEVNADGSMKQNRTFTYKAGMQIDVVIENWDDLTPDKLRPVNENVIQFKVYSYELQREKNIRVYLPCDYKISDKNYPVLYMLDGQNLFDDVFSYSGEWGIDETMDSICKLNKVLSSIIVGIDHAGEKRFTEYSPFYVNAEYGGGEGDEFAAFIADKLKPKIDSMYRTLSGRDYTAIAGSSMGGLESLYILLNYNTAFSKAGIFSPAFWTSTENFNAANKFNTALPTRVYFIAGAMEGEKFDYMNDMQHMYDLLVKKQIPQLQMRYIIESDGTHSERFWRSEFMECYKWLYRE